jgi:hypothetical protein
MKTRPARMSPSLLCPFPAAKCLAPTMTETFAVILIGYNWSEMGFQAVVNPIIMRLGGLGRA